MMALGVKGWRIDHMQRHTISSAAVHRVFLVFLVFLVGGDSTSTDETGDGGAEVNWWR